MFFIFHGLIDYCLRDILRRFLLPCEYGFMPFPHSFTNERRFWQSSLKNK